MVDFGAPEREEGGLERTLTDHVLAVSDAVDRVREATGRDVHLGGYSQGGMFCYQTAAYRRSDGIDSVITFGSPVDTRHGMPFGIPERARRRTRPSCSPTLFSGMVAAGVGEPNRLPAARPGQDTPRPGRVHPAPPRPRGAAPPRAASAGSSRADGWVAWPGPAMADFLRQFIAHNRMLEGGFVIEDRLVTLADISRPILAVVGTVDQIAPAAGVRAIAPGRAPPPRSTS